MTKVSIELTEEQKENLLNLANVGVEQYNKMLNQITGYEQALMMLVANVYKQQRTNNLDENQYLKIHEAIDDTLAELRQSRGKIHNDFFDVEEIEGWMKDGIIAAEEQLEIEAA